MFTVLEIKPFITQPFFRRVFAKPPQPSVEKVAVRGGAFYYKVTTSVDKSGIADLSFLPHTIGAAAQRIVFCGAYRQPLSAPLHLFVPHIFPTLLFVNTACDFLQANRERFANAEIGILDPDAQFQTAVHRFVPFAKSVSIYCKNPLQYTSVQNEILSSTGLSVIVCDTANVLNNCTVLLSPYFKTTDGKRGTLTVLRGGKTVLAGEGIELPVEYEARRPADTDRFLYASALYECCNVLDLRDLRYTTFVPLKSP